MWDLTDPIFPVFGRTWDPFQPLPTQEYFDDFLLGNFDDFPFRVSFFANRAGDRGKREQLRSRGDENPTDLGLFPLPEHQNPKKKGNQELPIKPRSIFQANPAIPASHFAAPGIITCCRSQPSRCCQLFPIAGIYPGPLDAPGIPARPSPRGSSQSKLGIK